MDSVEEGAVSPRLSSCPPELPYSLRDRKWSIAFFWTLFVIDTLAQPLILYFALWYATDLSHNLGMQPSIHFTVLGLVPY